MDCRLVPATGALLEEILDETYSLWNEGLTREAYGSFNRAQLRTTWGATHLERVALVRPDGRLLSTAKRYDLRACLDGRPIRALGIGAVFTPLELRRQGLAGELLGRLVDVGRHEGYDFALLFSAIGPDYYRRFGFQTIPVEQVALRVRYPLDRFTSRARETNPGLISKSGDEINPGLVSRKSAGEINPGLISPGSVKPGPPAINVRAGEDRDAERIAEMHRARAEAGRWRFWLDRDADFIRFSITRKRLLSGLGPRGLRELQYFVVDEADRAVAYVVMLNTATSCMIADCGDRDPAGARLGALMQALQARVVQEAIAHQPIHAWLPHGFRPPQLEVVGLERSPVTMMMRPIKSNALIDPPLTSEDVMYYLGDVV